MDFLSRVYHVLTSEAAAIHSIPSDTLNVQLPILAEWILQCKGKVITTGMGKLSSIAERVAATLSCTGTSSVFLSPSNAAHGDAGLVSEGDILLALSNSGKTREILEVVAQVRRRWKDIQIAVVTGHPDSPLSHLANLTLTYGVIEEPCPLGLTPSASLAVMSALLDALALGVMEMKGFTREDYLLLHHSGYIGAQLKGGDRDCDA